MGIRCARCFPDYGTIVASDYCVYHWRMVSATGERLERGNGRVAWQRGLISWHLLALGVGLLLLAWWIQRGPTFYSSDTGLRFMQVKSLLARGWQSPVMVNPGEALDPGLNYLPYYFAYARLGDQIYLPISALFPLLASLWYAWAGTVGLAVMPVLGAVFAAAAVYQLGRLSGLPHAYWGLWLAVVATPLLFYSLTFWDHTLGTAVLMWAMVGVAAGLKRKRPLPFILGGMLLGVGLEPRPEAYVFSVALGLGLLLISGRNWRPLGWTVGGAMAMAVPLWLLQYAWVGHPLGIPMAQNLFGYGVVAHDVDSTFGRTRAFQLTRFFTYIEPGNVTTLLATLCLLVGMVLIVFVLRLPRYRRRGFLFGGTAVTLLGYFLLLTSGFHKPITGLIATFPLLPFSLAYVRQPRREAQLIYRFCFATAWLFVVLMVLLWPTDGGKQWGVRYMLPVYPLLLYLGWVAVDSYREDLRAIHRLGDRVLVGSLLLATLAIQVVSVAYLAGIHREQRAVQAQINALPVDVVVTNILFLPPQMSGTDKIFLFVNDSVVPPELLAQMWRQGVRRLAVLPGDERPLLLPERGDDFVVEQISLPLVELRSAP